MDKQIHDVDVATNMPIDELKDKFYWHDNNDEKHGTFVKNADIFFMSKKELEKWLKLYQEHEKIKQSDEYKQYLKLKEKYSFIEER
jgi:hypothetical protein